MSKLHKHDLAFLFRRQDLRLLFVASATIRNISHLHELTITETNQAISIQIIIPPTTTQALEHKQRSTANSKCPTSSTWWQSWQTQPHKSTLPGSTTSSASKARLKFLQDSDLL